MKILLIVIMSQTELLRLSKKTQKALDTNARGTTVLFQFLFFLRNQGFTAMLPCLTAPFNAIFGHKT